MLFFLAVFLYSCTDQPKIPPVGLSIPPAIPVLNYSVRRVYAHDTTSYTEGFLVYDHQFFESSGSPADLPQTRSIVGIANIQSGRIEKKIELNKRVYFGEGIAIFKDKLYQLTYKNHTGFIYDAKTYQRLDSFRFQNNEGWALTTDSNSLIMSDGTSNLTFLNPVTLKPVKILAVTQSGTPVDSLNELEYIRGYIYANRYTQNYLLKIDPVNGRIVAKLDLSSLVDEEKIKNPGAEVLNGIAYDPEADKIYITGKLWSDIFQLDFPH
jgi:glutamine cyclotransferase